MLEPKSKKMLEPKPESMSLHEHSYSIQNHKVTHQHHKVLHPHLKVRKFLKEIIDFLKKSMKTWKGFGNFCTLFSLVIINLP